MITPLHLDDAPSIHSPQASEQETLQHGSRLLSRALGTRERDIGKKPERKMAAKVGRNKAEIANSLAAKPNFAGERRIMSKTKLSRNYQSNYSFVFSTGPLGRSTHKSTLRIYRGHRFATSSLAWPKYNELIIEHSSDTLRPLPVSSYRCASEVAHI
eukprot:4957558-Amphidinium_carterae.1